MEGGDTVERLLAEAREQLMRRSATEARAATERGEALLIDIRSDSQRSHDGVIPGAAFVPRNVLEWRLDPSCPHRDPELAVRDRELILVCNEGYQSSLAAATLKRFGLRTTDLIGGFQAWRDAGLPVEPGANDGVDDALS
jgi:rhodanese-related sulfurtransferase